MGYQSVPTSLEMGQRAVEQTSLDLDGMRSVHRAGEKTYRGLVCPYIHRFHVSEDVSQDVTQRFGFDLDV